MDKFFGRITDIIPRLCQLDATKTYVVEVKEPKSQRSLEQNRYMWQMIHSIAKATGHSDNEIYCTLLERADALSDYIITATEMEDALRKVFRGVKFMQMQEVNGKDCYIYKVYIGSSKMNTKEMTELIDETIKMCAENGIPVIEWDYE